MKIECFPDCGEVALGGKRQNKDKSIWKLISQRRNGGRGSRHCSWATSVGGNSQILSGGHGPRRLPKWSWASYLALDEALHEGFESWERGKQTRGPDPALPVVTSGQGHLWVSAFLQGKWRCVWLHESPTPYWMWHLTLSLFFIFLLSPEKGVPDDKVFFSLGRWLLFCVPVALAGFIEAKFPHCG